MTSATQNQGKATILFERAVDARTDRFTLEIEPDQFTLAKLEVSAGSERLRSRYAFRR